MYRPYPAVINPAQAARAPHPNVMQESAPLPVPRFPLGPIPATLAV